MSFFEIEASKLKEICESVLQTVPVARENKRQRFIDKRLQQKNNAFFSKLFKITYSRKWIERDLENSRGFENIDYTFGIYIYGTTAEDTAKRLLRCVDDAKTVFVSSEDFSKLKPFSNIQEIANGNYSLSTQDEKTEG